MALAPPPPSYQATPPNTLSSYDRLGVGGGRIKLEQRSDSIELWDIAVAFSVDGFLEGGGLKTRLNTKIDLRKLWQIGGGGGGAV